MESMQTIGKGIMQGINQFIDNDLQNSVCHCGCSIDSLFNKENNSEN